jgi:hypothetical protein
VALNKAYFELQAWIDQIVTQAEQQGSLAVAISGLNSIRHTLDSLVRLAGYDRPIESQVNVAVQTNINLDLMQITERVRYSHVVLVITAAVLFYVALTDLSPTSWTLAHPK